MKPFPQLKTQGQIDREVALVNFFHFMGQLACGAILIAALFAGYIMGVQ